MHGRAVACAALWTVTAAAMAQTEGAYPSKPVRIIVGFTPGSATDVTARIFAQKFTEAFGVAVNVDNMPGAAGAVSAARVAKLPPDGYTLYYGANGAMTIAPSLTSKPQYDPTTDFAPIGQLLTMAFSRSTTMSPRNRCRN
jgi:tripartite-type tricarboxylate transporter receptor subunit TctC